MSLFQGAGHDIGLTLAKIIQIEDSEELLSLKCPTTGIPVWSVLRVAFLREILGDLLTVSGTLDQPAPAGSAKAVGAVVRTIAHNTRMRGQGDARCDLVLHTDTIGDTWKGGLWFNRYADPFGDAAGGRAVSLIDLHDWNLRTPRHNSRYVYHTPLQVAATLMGRAPNSTARDLAVKALNVACARAEALIDWTMPPARKDGFAKWAAGKISAIPMRYSAYCALLERLQPRLLMTLAGCYGGQAPLIAAASAAHIPTAEFQHGSISAGHDAYSFAPAIFESSAFRDTLPDYLLTYGRWWGEQITAPVESIAIGQPLRAERQGMASSPHVEKKTVLVLGDGVEFEGHLELAQAISAAVRTHGLTVEVRPHPLERERIAKKWGTGAGEIGIDYGADIYSSFARAHTVLSEVSTGLFEAVGLVERIVMLETPKARFTYPTHPFTSACSQAEAIAKIVDPVSPSSFVKAEDLWASGWQQNFARFLRDKVGIDVYPT